MADLVVATVVDHGAVRGCGGFADLARIVDPSFTLSNAAAG